MRLNELIIFELCIAFDTQHEFTENAPHELRRRCAALRGRILDEKARQENLRNQIQILESEEKDLKVGNQALLIKVVMTAIMGG